jgi:hypothetical protein
MGAIRGAQVIYNSSLQFASQIPYGAGVGNQQYQNGVLVGGVPLTWAGGSSSLSVAWTGGRTMLSIDSDGIFPPSSSNLQLQVQNQRGNWMQAGSGALLVGTTQAYMQAFDAIPGQYRVFSNSGLTIGLNVLLTGISYGT